MANESLATTVNNSFQVNASQTFISGTQISTGMFSKEYWNQFSNIGTNFSNLLGKKDLKSLITSKIMSTMTASTLASLLSMCHINLESVLNGDTEFSEIKPAIQDAIDSKIEEIGYLSYNAMYDAVCKGQTFMEDNADAVWTWASKLITVDMPTQYISRSSYWSITYTKTPAQIKKEIEEEDASNEDVKNKNKEENKKEAQDKIDEYDARTEQIVKSVKDFKEKLNDGAALVATYWTNGPKWITNIYTSFVNKQINAVQQKIHSTKEEISDGLHKVTEQAAMDSGRFVASGINAAEKWAIRQAMNLAETVKEKQRQKVAAKLDKTAKNTTKKVGATAGKAIYRAIRITIAALFS